MTFGISDSFPRSAGAGIPFKCRKFSATLDALFLIVAGSHRAREGRGFHEVAVAPA
jgi:hypothetical protein